MSRTLTVGLKTSTGIHLFPGQHDPAQTTRYGHTLFSFPAVLSPEGLSGRSCQSLEYSYFPRPSISFPVFCSASHKRLCSGKCMLYAHSPIPRPTCSMGLGTGSTSACSVNVPETRAELLIHVLIHCVSLTTRGSPLLTRDHVPIVTSVWLGWGETVAGFLVGSSERPVTTVRQARAAAAGVL